MSTGVLQLIHRCAGMAVHSSLNDGQLLERFFMASEEAAFRSLLQRHGAMVLGVCRRILRNSDDAEDAFQATFLVLVRKGKGFLPRETIGNWLYGVAYYTALKAQAMAAKRRQKEAQLKDLPRPTPAAEEVWSDLQPLLDQELSRLPDKYREAVVLCELEGKSRKDAAVLLGIPEGILSSRLATAHRILAQKLKRHGLVLAAGSVTGFLAQDTVSAAMPTGLTTCTVQAASLMAAGSVTGGGIVSAQVAALTDGVLTSMFLSKLKFTTAMILALGLLTAGGVGLSQVTSSGAVHGQTKDASQPADIQKQIDKLITQLGSEKFAEREAATKELCKIGKTALPALEKATKSTDVEVSKRAQTIIDTIIPPSDPKDSFRILSVNGDMIVPLKGSYQQILIGDVNGNGKVVAVEIDAEEVWIGAVNGNAKVSFKGKTKKLRIGVINGDCQIDTSEFTAGEVEIGEINGSAKLKVHSTGMVTFSGALNGSASTTVTAIGEIRFAKIIEGGSALELTTRGNVLLDDRIAGNARLKVLLSKDFTVQGKVGDNVTVDANYFGESKCVGSPRARIQLNKVDAPK